MTCYKVNIINIETSIVIVVFHDTGTSSTRKGLWKIYARENCLQAAATCDNACDIKSCHTDLGCVRFLHNTHI